ncbi:MAG: membrane protein insertion efficiency factor YidD [Candidatus Glassbacteria bacterium]|nr:membrane protein insertion efficiency factor YidD [Candidatus Glassbacteria bacterium]
MLQRLLITGVDLYQWLLRPLLPPSCRFYPSCSEYARLSLVRYGPFKGSLKALVRLLKCHPFHPGGVDLP